MLMATGKDQALLACSSTVAHSSHRADEQVGEEERRGGEVECLGGAGRSARTEVEADLHAATHGGGARGGLARDGDLLVAGGRRAEGTGRPWRCATNSCVCCGWSLQSGGSRWGRWGA